MKELRISIVTVCYNSQGTIERTIQSVLGQTYNNIEYIIIDGESTDGTLDIIRKYNSRITWKSEKDKGIYDAMNKALDMATGDFLLFLGADDVLYSKRVIGEVCQKIHSYDHIYCGDALLKETGRVSSGKFCPYRFAIKNICHQTIFYPRSAYIQYKYNQKYKVYADYAYNLHLAAMHYGFIHLPIMISIYSTIGFSSKTADPLFWQDKAKLVRQALGAGPALFLWAYSEYRKFFPHSLHSVSLWQ